VGSPGQTSPVVLLRGASQNRPGLPMEEHELRRATVSSKTLRGAVIPGRVLVPGGGEGREPCSGGLLPELQHKRLPRVHRLRGQLGAVGTGGGRHRQRGAPVPEAAGLESAGASRRGRVQHAAGRVRSVLAAPRRELLIPECDVM